MEQWELNIIVDNSDTLVEHTNCNDEFLENLIDSKVFSRDEANEVIFPNSHSIFQPFKDNQLLSFIHRMFSSWEAYQSKLEHSKRTQSRRFYKIFISKSRDFSKLLTGLQDTKQYKALEIFRTVGLQPGSSYVSCDDVSTDFKEKLTLGDSKGKQIYGSSHKKFDVSTLVGAQLVGRGKYNNCVHKTVYDRKDIAVKSISPNQLYLTEAATEMKQAFQLEHKNILKVLFATELKCNSYIFGMQLCEISLHEWIKQKQPLIFPMDILQQITTGISFLHENKTIHGNLKPTNILLSSELGNVCVKISDLIPRIQLDLSKNSITVYDCDTVGWMAPEVLQAFSTPGVHRKFDFTAASDVFSLGCVYYFVMTDGKHPFGGRLTRIGNILKSQYIVSLNHITSVSQSNACIVINMTNKNEALRPSANSLLNHHIFWSSTMTLHFIELVAECCKNDKSIIAKDCIQGLETYSPYVLNCPSKVLNWVNYLSVPIQTHLKEFEKKTVHSNRTSSIVDLINAIPYFRNLSPNIELGMGDCTDEVLYYWILKQYPFLVPVLWKLFENMKDNERLLPYYKHFTVSHYQVIQAIDILQSNTALNQGFECFTTKRKSESAEKKNTFAEEEKTKELALKLHPHVENNIIRHLERWLSQSSILSDISFCKSIYSMSVAEALQLKKSETTKIQLNKIHNILDALFIQRKLELENIHEIITNFHTSVDSQMRTHVCFPPDTIVNEFYRHLNIDNLGGAAFKYIHIGCSKLESTYKVHNERIISAEMSLLTCSTEEILNAYNAHTSDIATTLPSNPVDVSRQIAYLTELCLKKLRQVQSTQNNWNQKSFIQLKMESELKIRMAHIYNELRKSNKQKLWQLSNFIKSFIRKHTAEYTYRMEKFLQQSANGIQHEKFENYHVAVYEDVKKEIMMDVQRVIGKHEPVQRHVCTLNYHIIRRKQTFLKSNNQKLSSLKGNSFQFTMTGNQEKPRDKANLVTLGNTLLQRANNFKFRSSLAKDVALKQIKEAVDVLNHPKITLNGIQKQYELLKKYEVKLSSQNVDPSVDTDS